MTGIEWRDPPPAVEVNPLSGRRTSAWHARFVQELRENPKRWALLGVWNSRSNAHTFKSSLQRGAIVAYQPPDAFEVITNRIEGDKYEMFVRYVGDVEP